ncbi:RidA family protein [Nanchangia anserum]|uniref:RidA family protein n=1 Tax=Nanchangia anserum TaxID=2692125 RepID=A0A8I0GCM3_9ACTO|nr:RidA family protein [Nanchangia anserum]MBD3689546.1 RidA family protein [Nanchangia anserum]QOX81734.1 RidA family protein [Nanchangia anserum]
MESPHTQQRVRPSEALEKLGLSLPEVPVPLAAYTPAAIADGRWPEPGDDYVIATSGQLPFDDNGDLAALGHVGPGDHDVSADTAYQCARLSALGAIAAAAQVAGGVDNLLAVVKVTAFIASRPDFTDQAQVANGASELFGEVFGQPGLDPSGNPYPKAHVRSAIGVAVLPLNAPIEIEVEFLARKNA